MLTSCSKATTDRPLALVEVAKKKERKKSPGKESSLKNLNENASLAGKASRQQTRIRFPTTSLRLDRLQKALRHGHANVQAEDTFHLHFCHLAEHREAERSVEGQHTGSKPEAECVRVCVRLRVGFVFMLHELWRLI